MEWYAGGLQLQLGGFSGIDYNSLTGNSGASRGSSPVNLELTDTPASAGSTLGKVNTKFFMYDILYHLLANIA